MGRRAGSARAVAGAVRRGPPFGAIEATLLRAVRGRAYYVVIDLRPDSPAYHRWVALELDAAAMNAVFVPAGCAHGFLTLQPTPTSYIRPVRHACRAMLAASDGTSRLRRGRASRASTDRYARPALAGLAGARWPGR